MSTSPFGAIIQVNNDALFDQENPIDTSHVRALINNALHYADQSSRVLVNWVAKDSNSYLAPSTASGLDTARLDAVFSARLPITRDSDGGARSFRYRIAFASQTASNTTTAVIGIGHGPTLEHGLRQVFVTGTDEDNIESASLTSSSISWSAAGVLTLPTSELNRILTVRVDGTSQSVEVAEAVIMVGLNTDNVSSEPRLFGVHFAEYLAP